MKPKTACLILAAASALSACRPAPVPPPSRTPKMSRPAPAIIGKAAAPKPAPETGRGPVERFPAGTVFVTHHGGRTYYATDKYVALRPANGGPETKAPYLNPFNVAFSPDGTRLLIQYGPYAEQVAVLRAADLRPLGLRNLPYNTQAWWHGEHLAYFDGYEGTIRVGRHRLSASIGPTEVVTADPRGHYLLTMRQIRLGTRQNGEVPTNLLALWELTPQERLRPVRRLTTDEFDGASVGTPCHLSVLNPQTLVFGEPIAGAAWYDSIWTLCRGRIREVGGDVTDNGGTYTVQFSPQPALVTPHAIYGLTDWFGNPSAAVRRRLPLYLYCVTNASVSVRRISPSAVFLTDDPSRGGVGIGYAEHEGVTVRYGGFPKP